LADRFGWTVPEIMALSLIQVHELLDGLTDLERARNA
jgi:hypothetical protein